jgi:hypothetical protein
MSSTSFNIKPLESYFSTRPPNLNRQGKAVPTKNNVDFIGEYSINFTIKQKNNFEPVFNSLSSNMLKQKPKSERIHYNPLSALEISNIKLNFKKEAKKRKERSLYTILFSHRDDEPEIRNRGLSSRYRPKTADCASKSLSAKVEN